MNYADLTPDELIDKGFRRWNNDTNLYLIPGSLFEEAKLQTELFDINGDRVVDAYTIDDDTRGGLLAYGVVPKTLRDQSSLYKLWHIA